MPFELRNGTSGEKSVTIKDGDVLIIVLLVLIYLLAGCVPASMSAHKLRHIREGTHHHHD